MKIITWNCQMAFRKKCNEVLRFNPDILVIPECESGEKLQFGKLVPKPIDFFWYGDNAHKGIGVFAYGDYHFELHPSFNPAFRYIIPLNVSGNQNFTLLAVWAMPNKLNRKQRYIGQVWSGLQHYKDLLETDTLVIGDFNGNQIWDKNSYTGNFTQTMNFLEERNFQSLYHLKTGELYGQETQPTFYLYRNKDKSYHMDYCVIKENMIQKGMTIEVGQFQEWIPFSDHMPLIIELKE